MYERTGMGWTNWRKSPGEPCSQTDFGQQRCFRTTTVNGSPPEQNFAAAQGCIRIGDPCSTSSGNPGNVWCCPAGCPRGPGQPVPAFPCGPMPTAGGGVTSGESVIPHSDESVESGGMSPLLLVGGLVGVGALSIAAFFGVRYLRSKNK